MCHSGSGSSLVPLQARVQARFFTRGSPVGRSSFQVLLPQLVQNLGVREMTTPEILPGGYYQRGGCFQDNSPAHTHPRQLEDSRQARGRQGGPWLDQSAGGDHVPGWISGCQADLIVPSLPLHCSASQQPYLLYPTCCPTRPRGCPLDCHQGGAGGSSSCLFLG